MPTSSETAVQYIPKYIVLNDQNTHTYSTQSVRDITVNLPQLESVPTTAGLSTVAKGVIIVSVATGVAAALATTVALLIIFVANTTTTTVTTTTSTTTTSTITTSTVTTPMAAPTNLVGYRGNNYQNYTFTLTGSTSGSLWGTTIYTDDSNVAVAAVHAGFVTAGQISIVTVIILPGQSSYTSTTQHGITSSSYGSWSGSYSFLSAVAAG